NLYMANNLFNVRLHDRLGETQYTDVLTGERKVTSLWLRNVAGHSTVKSGDGQLKTGTNRYVVQLGGDIAQWSDNDLNRYHIGLMAGYGRISGKTTNHVTKTRAKSDADGYSAGIYGTYYANEADKSGLYVDSWVQYNWFKNRINGDELPEEKYNSDGITLSAEAGYSFLINETQGSDGSTNRWFIQPKAQVTYMGVKMDTHTERGGTRVSATGEGNIQTRLGVRVYGLGQALQDKDNDRHFQPFAEINWLNNSKMTGVSMDDDHVGQSGTRNIGEIKVGIEGQLTRNADIWFNVAQQAGSDHYSDTQGMLGLKYRF
ncbi:autotransporter outer membrane beta-barrel domain-containing protein, partial [Morganella morganii]